VFFTYAYHESRGVPWETVVEGIASGREIAGEDVGPGSVWDALVALDIDRIDHGVRSVEELESEAAQLRTDLGL